MEKKRLLIFTNHFYPESFKVNDIAFDMALRGMEVTVLTCIPNYPGGSFFNGYGLFKKRTERVNEVTVKRVLLIPRGDASSIRLVLNYSSYLFFLTMKTIGLLLKRRYDVIFVHHTSPIFVAIPAIIAKKILKVRMVFWDLDLWPESLIAASNIQSKRIFRSLLRLVKWCYKNCDRIFIGSKSFEHSLKDKVDDLEKIKYLPNWAEDIFTEEISYSNEQAAFLDGIVKRLPAGFKIMFAGNIGEAQDFESIIQAAILLKGTTIRILIVGDGRKKDWVKNAIDEHNLQEHIFLLGRYDIRQMPLLFSIADVMMVTLKDKPVFSLTAPAKIQAYMASKKPILTMLNGEGTRIICESKCGMSAPAGNAHIFAENAIKLSKLSQQQLQLLGSNGLKYYNLHFDKKKNLEVLYHEFLVPKQQKQ